MSTEHINTKFVANFNVDYQKSKYYFSLRSKKYKRARLQFEEMSKSGRTIDSSVQNVDGIIKFMELVGNLKVRIIFIGEMT